MWRIGRLPDFRASVQRSRQKQRGRAGPPLTGLPHVHAPQAAKMAAGERAPSPGMSFFSSWNPSEPDMPLIRPSDPMPMPFLHQLAEEGWYLKKALYHREHQQQGHLFAAERALRFFQPGNLRRQARCPGSFPLQLPGGKPRHLFCHPFSHHLVFPHGLHQK